MMQESSSPQLRPLSMGELFDRIIRLYRQNFLTFIGIVALVQIPVTIVQLIVALFSGNQLNSFVESGFTEFNPQTTSSIVTSGLLSTVVTILAFVLVQGLGTAALTRAVGNSYLGQKTSILDAYRQIKGSWFPLVRALFLAGLIAILLFVWIIIPCIGWVTGPGAFVYYAWVVIPLIAPVIVLERQRARDGVRRIWSLVRRRFWPVFWFAILLIIFNQLVIAGPTSLVNLIFQFGVGDGLNPTNDQFILQTVVQTVVTMIFSLLYLPLQLTGYTLLYFDLRVRLEGFDLAVLASESKSDGTFDAVGAIESAPQGDAGFVVTRDELGRFALITIGGGILYAVLVGILGAIISATVGSPF